MTNLYLQAFYALPFPCVLLEPRENGFFILDANQQFYSLYECSKDQVQGKSYPYCSDKLNLGLENRKLMLQSLQKVYSTGKVDKFRLYNLERGNGQKKGRSWTLENIPVKNELGTVVHILNLAVDHKEYIPEKEDNDLKLSLNNQEYDTFVRKNKDGLYSLDAEGNFLSLNEGLCELAELSQEEMLKRNFLPFCAGHDREKTIAHFQKALQGKSQNFEAEFVSAKGNILVLEVTLFPMKISGKVSGVFGIAKNKTPVKQRESEFFRNEKRLKALVHEGSDLVGILEPNGTYKFVSDTVRKVLGTTPEFYIGKNAFDFIHPDDKDKVMTDFSLLGNEKQVKISLFRFRDALGKWRWMETLVTNLLEEPYVEGLVTNSRDVTELVEKTQKIKQLYERYTLAAEATEDVIYDWDLISDEVIRFHKSTEKLFGYSRKEIDQPDFWRSNIHPEDLPEIISNLKRHLDDPNQQHVRSQYRFRRADGSYAQIIDRSSIVRKEDGEAVRLIGATIDISGIMRNKEALKMANKRFSYAMRATKEMIWDWDIVKGRIKRSGSFRKTFGYGTSKTNSPEKSWFDKIAEKDREKIRKSVFSALEDRSVKKWREEYCFVKKNGEEAFVIDRGYILRDNEGKAIRMIGAALDVTESRRMMKEIQKQNQVLKEVAWEQAHVVRAPLARLKGLLDLLEEECYEEWSREELMELIKSSAEEVDNIIENIVRKTEKIES